MPVMRFFHRHRAFTLLEIIIVIGIIAMLMAILLPTMERVRNRGYRVSCESNLRQIGEGLSMYANENHGNYPRTIYDPAQPLTKGTGAAAANPFGPGGPAANDLTAPLFLLARTEKLPPIIFNCPYNDVHEYEPDRPDVLNRSNFTDYRKNCGYSYANPYPNSTAKEYRLTSHIRANFAVAADINPGSIPVERDDALAPTPTSPTRIMEKANSPNHEKEGQNVLFGDGHVSWLTTPFVGVNNDNIYTTQSGTIEGSPANKDDSVLLPTDD